MFLAEVAPLPSEANNVRSAEEASPKSYVLALEIELDRDQTEPGVRPNVSV